VSLETGIMEQVQNLTEDLGALALQEKKRSKDVFPLLDLPDVVRGMNFKINMD